jgi:F-type H+-transporting ATPase subunit delta
MRISVKQYAQSLYESVQGKSDKEAAEVVVKFVQTLRQHYDIAKVKDIINIFSEIWNNENKEIEAELTTAREATSISRELIVKYLKEKTGAEKIELSEKVDQSIIGGFILKYGSKILDGSLKNSLAGLKNKISN